MKPTDEMVMKACYAISILPPHSPTYDVIMACLTAALADVPVLAELQQRIAHLEQQIEFLVEDASKKSKGQGCGGLGSDAMQKLVG